MSAAAQHKKLYMTDDSAAKNRAAILSVIVALLLIALKTTSGFVTGAISVWASLLDSTIDLFASLVNFFAVRAAARPPDREHTYGHGKAESLASLFQSLIIIFSALYLIWNATNRLLAPRETQSAWFGIITMLAAIAISVFLVARLRSVARATDSPAISADATHYISDLYTNFGALIALFLTALTHWRLADPLISIAISLYILLTAARLLRESVDVLMDRRLPSEIDETIADVVKDFQAQGVRGFHNLRTRRSGSFKFIDLHLEVERTQTLEDAHNLTVRVLRAIEARIPRSRVQIHTDPWD